MPRVESNISLASSDSNTMDRTAGRALVGGGGSGEIFMSRQSIGNAAEVGGSGYRYGYAGHSSAAPPLLPPSPFAASRAGDGSMGASRAADVSGMRRVVSVADVSTRARLPFAMTGGSAGGGAAYSHSVGANQSASVDARMMPSGLRISAPSLSGRVQQTQEYDDTSAEHVATDAARRAIERMVSEFGSSMFMVRNVEAV